MHGGRGQGAGPGRRGPVPAEGAAQTRNAFDAHLGENPLNIALRGGHVGIADLLLAHGARGDYLLPGLATAFGAMQHLRPETRQMLIELLAARGVTRDGLFRSLYLERDYGYESPKQAFGW